MTADDRSKDAARPDGDRCGRAASFENGQAISARRPCEGADLSPAFSWAA
jgi:hypothetical protein